VELGITHAKKSDYKSAMKFYNQALQVDPKNKDAYVARGAAFANVNMLEDAVLDFEKALTIDGTDANANKYLAIIREKLRQQRETREAAQYIPSTPQPMSKHSSIAPHDGQGITTAQKLKMLIEADKRSSSTPSSSQHRKSTKDRERDKDSDKYKDKDKDKDKRHRRDKRQSKRSSKKKHKKRHRDDTRGRSSASPSKSRFAL
jgi:tetratricopeptide (TPR) repeat protein